MASTRLLHTKFDFTAYGLFPLNRTLLLTVTLAKPVQRTLLIYVYFQVVSALTTYTTILAQLEKPLMAKEVISSQLQLCTMRIINLIELRF